LDFFSLDLGSEFWSLVFRKFFMRVILKSIARFSFLKIFDILINENRLMNLDLWIKVAEIL